MADATQILVRANDIIEMSDVCTGAHARDKDGNQISQLDSRATAFCCVGAIVRAGFELGEIPSSIFSEPMREAFNVFAGIAAIPEGMSVTQWNDCVEEERIREAFAQASRDAQLVEQA